MSTQFSDVIDEYLTAIASEGYSKNTLRNHRSILGKALAHIGNIQVKAISERHVDSYMSALAAKGVVAGTLNANQVTLGRFFSFCQRRRYVPLSHNPVEHRRPYRGIPRPKLRVPMTDFAPLLDAAAHPRDRMVVALGLFLLLRQSEVASLKLGDVNLVDREITVTLHKTRDRDTMPISSELDAELRRWLTYYAERMTPHALHDSWFLVPAKTPPKVVVDSETGRRRVMPLVTNLRPTRPITRMQEIPKRALAALGYEVPKGEGMHTLRRSGATALFHLLREQGYDEALATVQALLHHKSGVTTEIYLSLDLDKVRRNERFKGQAMYDLAPSSAVIPLREVQ